MSTQRARFELFTRLQSLGFTYDEAASLRRIEMTLRRWAEAECNGDIQRDEATGKPVRRFRTHPDICYSNDRAYAGIAEEHLWPIADREAGALKRLAAIVAACNARLPESRHDSRVIPYHQTDPRGCALYLIRQADLAHHKIDEVYNRGLAVCC